MLRRLECGLPEVCPIHTKSIDCSTRPGDNTRLQQQTKTCACDSGSSVSQLVCSLPRRTLHCLQRFSILRFRRWYATQQPGRTPAEAIPLAPGLQVLTTDNSPDSSQSSSCLKPPGISGLLQRGLPQTRCSHSLYIFVRISTDLPCTDLRGKRLRLFSDTG